MTFTYYLFRGFVIGSVVPGACVAGFEHTLAGKGIEGCVSSLPALRTKHSFSHAAPLPNCQHRLKNRECHFLKWLLWGRQSSCLTFNWIKCDTQYSLVLGSSLCHESDTLFDRNPWSEVQLFFFFICLKDIWLYNRFLFQFQYCRDIHFTPMNDILIMIRGLQFHHSLMWEIWTGGLLATTCHYSYVFLSYHCAKRLAVGEGLAKGK